MEQSYFGGVPTAGCVHSALVTSISSLPFPLVLELWRGCRVVSKCRLGCPLSFWVLGGVLANPGSKFWYVPCGLRLCLGRVCSGGIAWPLPSAPLHSISGKTPLWRISSHVIFLFLSGIPLGSIVPSCIAVPCIPTLFALFPRPCLCMEVFCTERPCLQLHMCHTTSSQSLSLFQMGSSC